MSTLSILSEVKTEQADIVRDTPMLDASTALDSPPSSSLSPRTRPLPCRNTISVWQPSTTRLVPVVQMMLSKWMPAQPAVARRQGPHSSHLNQTSEPPEIPHLSHTLLIPPSPQHRTLGYISLKAAAPPSSE
ncbi:hypothetical protein BS47DRAFT_674551 [Hydnum rufescens UP504]|uniref:Uncharacterized protein n=1 Tax=Hydnum rufescens UP504 TaxID=1448309 RepID=A0A9P6B2F4_9AGAM|nr:hypothetical protein BS47DRAFT_674551 [Hydnum rufescens UP504]